MIGKISTTIQKENTRIVEFQKKNNRFKKLEICNAPSIVHNKKSSQRTTKCNNW